MNKCIFCGRFVADPETRYTQGNTPMAVTRFRLAVDRRYKREGEPSADFLNMVAFGKSAENIGKYFGKGSMILIESHVQMGTFTNREGQKVYTTDFVIDAWEFVGARTERPSEGQSDSHSVVDNAPEGEFMDIPDDVNEELPWN